ncbi:cysteine desulfurase NifS [Laceyella sacchari]|uniref:cysteine desulfurase n=2 Tax=Laceyella TaxID=292635 RepID=A0AA45WM76_9BACL|nr:MULTISPECIES: cysteine desulfurase family protein [Laceyella]AUS09572.1 cysteine desulfurase NifS [Laceyella sacchari]MRG29652.1 aminotransferase class V-fold PLP-dependent enzyme [Laceyella tengchongensis]PRZ17252.1 cysteine desulfurase [Laceyella sediminis]SMP13714.1 cysteine desulfurase [Laceyella tengchongensis]
MMAIYLDHAATTPIHPLVKEAMLPYLGEAFGNPSSMHQYGRDVRVAIDQARDQVARALGADAGQLVFTSGGTEADNMALLGVAAAYAETGKKHLITTQIEHHAVLDACRYLERIGFEVTYLPVDHTGLIDLEQLRQAIRDDTTLISIMMANNEIGTVQPIEQIGELARERGVLFHTDAVQAFGSLEIDVKRLPVDLISVSGHKINGPKGIGALYLGKNVKFIPRTFGGSQERRRRPGTENVMGIIGFAKAVELSQASREQHMADMRVLRQAFVEELNRQPIEFVVNGHPTKSLPHILNVSFPGTDSETLLMNFDLAGIACASGSACTSGTLEVSHVLQSMHLSEERTRSAIRFSFGRGNTVDEIKRAAEMVASIVHRLQRHEEI